MLPIDSEPLGKGSIHHLNHTPNSQHRAWYVTDAQETLAETLNVKRYIKGGEMAQWVRELALKA